MTTRRLLAPALLSLVAVATSFALGCGTVSTQTEPLASPPGSTCAAGASDVADGLAELSDEQLARKLLKVSGGVERSKMIGDSLMESLRKVPEMPPGFIDRFKQNIQAVEHTELIIPIYLKHYDRATMTAAIRFYQSEHGRTLLRAMPVVTAESLEVGKAWGRDLARKTLEELGVIPPP